MQSNRKRMAVMAICVIAAGCAGVRRAPVAADEHQRELNHGYSLLHGVVAKQAALDKLFLLKKPSLPTRALIEEIAQTSQQASSQLQELADKAPVLDLNDPGLPAMENNTRQAIEVSTRNHLLFGSGFELRLLLTQIESSNYISHLASELARLEDHKTRSEQLEAIATKFKDINDRVIARLQVVAAATASTP